MKKIYDVLPDSGLSATGTKPIVRKCILYENTFLILEKIEHLVDDSISH